MKNRKGFTLIELIAVVVILGLVLIIAIPFFSGTLKTFRDDYYTNLNGNMLNAGKEFFQDNRIYLPHKYLDSAIVDANTLTGEKILEVLKDYNGDKCEQLESYVIAIRKSKDEISYDTCIKCLDDNYDNFDEKEACSLAWKEGEGFTEVIFDKPDPVYIYKGTSRSELKKLVVTYPDVRRCLGKSGICEQEIMRVSGKGEDGLAPIYPINLDTVNPDKLGTYNIKYKYENYGTTVDGKVVVFQNTAPTVNITKTNKVKEGTITTNDVSKTTAYDKSPSNRDNWAQQLNFTFKYDFGTDAKPGLYVTKYQIFFNNRWEDYCTPARGTNTCTKTETREMDEIVKFRSIDSEGHISTFTENIGLRIDRTKPSCQLRTDGTYGLRQWYITDVKISFQSKDDNYGTKPFPNANPVKSGESFSGITLSQIKSNTYDTQKTDTNWITWYGYIEDKANNYQICNISFKRDATAPKCEFTIPAADGDDGWHKMPIVTVQFKTHTDTSGQPDYSGVEDYGFNTWNSGTKVVNHTADTASVTYNGEIRDMAGNKSTCKISFKKDSTVPECVATRPEPDGDNGWHKMATVPVTIKSQSDNLSGVRNIGINSWNSGVKRVDHTADTNGITYTYQIRDIAGNMNTCSTWFKKDSTNPKCELIIPAADGEKGWHKMGTVKVEFKTHTDTSGQSDYSGVRDYGIGSWNSGTKVVNHTNNSSSISYTGYIRDNAGNSSSCSTSFKLDSTPPTCTAKVPTPDGDEDGGSKWHKMGTVKVEINTTYDNLSGVEDYGINSWNSGTKVVNHTTDTAGTTYTYQIKDNAGNKNTCSVWFKKDSTQPQCAVYTTGTNGTNGWYKIGTVNGAFSSYTDNLSGVRTYGFDSNTGNHTKSTTTSTAGSTWTGYIKDKAGNTNSCTTSFKFDNIAPTCSSGGGSTWTNQNVTITGTCSDTGYSGCKENISKTYSSEINSSTETPGTVYDNAGNSVLCPQNRTIQIDKTNPVCSTSGEQGKWVNYNVTLYGTCTDPNGSTHSGCTGNTSTTYTSNTNENKTSGTVCDTAGNCITCPTKLVQIDKTAPSCSSSSSPSGWTNGSVTVTGTCSDTGGSGCAHGASVTKTGQQNTNVSPGSACDVAGNCTTCPTSSVKIDTTAPTCSGSVGGYNTESGVTFTVTCSDTGGSGCSSGAGTYGPWKPTGTSGDYSYTVKDAAGNTSSACKIHVWGQLQGKSYHCRASKRCEAAGCETYKSCENSACGVNQYKSCENSACGVNQYKSCANSACGQSCSGSCSCVAYNVYTTKSFSGESSCPGNSGCKSKCGGSSATMGGTQSSCSCSNKTCRTSGCGVDSYNTCRTSGCGVESYKTCSTSGCGCDTYNESCSTCGCDAYNEGNYEDDNFCNATSSGGCSYRVCRWVYRGTVQG